MAIEAVKQTNLQQSRKWRNRANRGRQNQRVEKDQLVWVKEDYTTSLGDRKLGLKWVGPYKVKEVIREGSAYKLEDVFKGEVIQQAADKVKPYVGQDNILIQPREMFLQEIVRRRTSLDQLGTVCDPGGMQRKTICGRGPREKRYQKTSKQN